MITINENVPFLVTVPLGASVSVSTDGALLVEAVSGLGVAAGTIASGVYGSATYGPWTAAGVVRLTPTKRNAQYSVGVIEYDAAFSSVAGSPSALKASDGSVFALSEVTPYVTRTSTGTAFTGVCELAGYDCTAVTGTPTITIYDNTSAAGTVIVPATTLTVGRVEFAWKRALTTGCHVVLSGTQTVNVLVG